MEEVNMEDIFHIYLKKNSKYIQCATVIIVKKN